MGQLQAGIPPDPLAGGDTLRHRPLGGPDGGRGTGIVVVGLQVYHAHQALAQGTILKCPLYVDKGIGICPEQAAGQIGLHGPVDLLGVSGLLGSAQLCLRQNQAQGRGGLPDRFGHAGPISGVRGKLVAGNDCPFLHRIHLGDQNICRHKCVHQAPTFRFVFPANPGRVSRSLYTMF